jgi:hypothetical protein
LRSLDPCESFVRFFLRKPNEGMGAAVGWGSGAACSRQAATAKSTSGGSAAVEHSTRCLARSGEANNARHARRELPRVQRTPLGARGQSCNWAIAAWTMTAQEWSRRGRATGDVDQSTLAAAAERRPGGRLGGSGGRWAFECGSGKLAPTTTDGGEVRNAMCAYRGGWERRETAGWALVFAVGVRRAAEGPVGIVGIL